MIVSGSCHCGAVRFECEGAPRQAYECNCSHCNRKGLLLWFIPRSALRITQGENDLRTYTFNRHAIRHQFCPTCGCQPFGLGTSPDGSETAAINLRCGEDLDLTTIERIPVDGKAR
jgi:hypothetical protein